ncbi:hypothetical protein [Zymomonas sp.]|uniref:hypothetical protein n=1 Tax=Zymomonas sp. TaxID=2068624 RepID=UPI0025CEA776|nr:hypothetical protein [Zymomonas sp.]MCA1955756.1 hypothetical protein [Zymomonas sp.]
MIVIARWSGLGMVSVFLLIAAMLGATFLLRPIFLQSMALHPAAYMADGIGLLFGAVVNLFMARLFKKIWSKTEHSFLGIGMTGWSVMAVIGGIALIIYSYYL